MFNQNTRFYKHYKNKPYRLLGTARHSETLEEMALYETLYENKLGQLWVRPKDMFFETVEIEGVLKPRFQKINFELIELCDLNENQVQEIAILYKLTFNKIMNLTKFHSIIRNHSQKHFLLAFENKKLIGFKLGFARDSEMFNSWIGAVHPDYQKLGVASQLMSQQHQWALGQKFNKIETRTRNEFVNMIRLNLKFGFKIVGTTTSENDRVKIILEKKLHE